ncbi:hypothetical protein AQUCO_00500637v1 [Aquilegia coerulea]|uniref:Uncharacterized protein n=1 Tax=Aquilegia coerulea TaxID=218851 RepID=A0A2G5ET14_AQUCA|nr:hypothetical protein AQUCO_00500637v1 [Aquilegia coerulea]
MDFHTLSRRELQTLCKKNKIPANITNVAMADALTNLTKVEGIDEIGNGETVMQTPQTCKESRIRKPIKDSVVSMEIESGTSSIALTRTRRSTQTRNTQEIIENPLEMLKTPATRGRRKAVGSVSNKIDSENNQDNEIEKEPSVVSQVRTRRSVRLSEKKACVSVPKKGGRKTEAIKISALSEEESDDIQQEKGDSLVVPQDASSMVVSDITTDETPTAESEESSLAIQEVDDKALLSEEVLDGIKNIALSDTTEENPNVGSDELLVGNESDNKVIVSDDISDAEVSVDNFTTENNSNLKSDEATFVDSKLMPEDGSDAVFDFEKDLSYARVFDFDALGADDIIANKDNMVFGDTSNVDADQILIPVDDVSNVNANQNLIPGDTPVAVTADSESVPLNSAAGGELSDENQSRVDKNSSEEDVLDILKMGDRKFDANADIMEFDKEGSDETSPKQLTSSETIEASAVGQLNMEVLVSDPSKNEMNFSENCDNMLETGEGTETEDSETVDSEESETEGSETEDSETDDSEGSESETEAKADFDAIESIGRATVTPKSSNKKRATPTSKMIFKVYNENEENNSGDMSSRKEATPISKLVVAEDKENNQDGDGTQKRALKQKSLRQLRKMFKNKLALENNHDKVNWDNFLIC